MPSKKPPPSGLRVQFGRNVAQLRVRRSLTQEKLAETLGISTRYLQALEAGDYWPTLPNLVKLRIAFGASWDELLAGCDTL